MTVTPGATAPSKSPRERRLWWLLTGSFAVNLLVLGAVVGTAMGWDGHVGAFRSSRGEDFGLMGFSRTLPSERGKEVRRSIRQERVSLRPLFDDIDGTRGEAAKILATEPFNRDAFKQALDRLAEGEDKLKHAVLDVMLKTTDKLSADERKALGEWWDKRREKDRAFRKRVETKDAGEDTSSGKDGAPPQ